MLEKLGAERVGVQAPDLASPLQKVDAVLDLIGNSTILGSLDIWRRGGSAAALQVWRVFDTGPGYVRSAPVHRAGVKARPWAE